MKQEYPKFVYFLSADGKTVESKIIQSAAEMKKSYKESPADIEVSEAAPSEPAPVEVPVVPVVPEVAKQLAAEVQAELDAFYKAPAKLIADRIKKIEKLEELIELRELEENRPGGPRLVVQRALADQIGVLSVPKDAPSE